MSVALKTPKQTKLLGAEVRDVGIITTVSAELFDCFVLIEGEGGREHHRFVKNLTREELAFPSDPLPYRAATRRIGYGLWGDVLELESVYQSGLTHVGRRVA